MPNIEISDLPNATLPVDPLQSFFEVQTVEGGENVSRRISANDISINLPDGTTLGSIIVLDGFPDTYINNEQVIADGTNVLLNTTQVIADGTNVFLRDTTHAAVGANLSTFLEGISVATELAAADNTVTALRGGVRLQDLDGVTTLGTLDFQNAVLAGALLMRNATEGGFISLRGTATAGSFGDRIVFQGDPDGASTMFNLGVARALTTASGMTINAGGSLGLITLFATSSVASFYSQYNGTNGGVALKNQNPDARLVQISTGGGEEDIWIEMVRDGLVGLYHNNTLMTRTVIAASGGLEVNNTVTGGGFERVLTTADIFGGALNDLSDVVITSADSFDTLFFNGSDWVDTAMLQITGTGATMGGATLGITGIGVRGRFNSVGESGGSTQTRVVFSDDDGGTAYGEVEWATTGGGVDGDSMYFRNRRHAGHIQFEGEDAAGLLVPAWDFDPDVPTFTLNVDVRVDGGTTRFISMLPTGGADFRITDVAGVPDIVSFGMLGQNAQLTMTDTEIVTLGNIATGSGATFIGGGINDRIDFLADTTNNLRFQWTTGRWDIHSLTNGDDIALQADQGGGATSTVLLGDPNGSTDLFFANVSKLSTENLGVTMTGASGGFLLDANGVAFATPSDIRARNSEGGFRLRADGDNFALFQTDLNGTNEDTWMTATNNAGLGFYHNNAETARTLTVATGGLEADNQLTGAGFRRVLTEADALTDTLLADTSIPAAAFVTILTVRAEANFNYAITGMILLDVPDAGDDSSWRFTLPAGATGEVQWMGFDQTGAAHFRTTQGGLFSSNDAGGVSLTSYAFTGMLRIAGTAGDVDIDIAKLLDVGGDALAKDGSWMKLVPVLEAP